MKYRILVRGAAERDISQAQDWYQKEASLAVEFHQELSATLHILSDTP